MEREIGDEASRIAAQPSSAVAEHGYKSSGLSHEPQERTQTRLSHRNC